MKRILVVEPYFGGSHKQFLIGLKENIEADFIFLTLPARKWKMRMQLSAPWFAECIDGMSNKYFDTVLCSTFVDVAVLKALLIKQKNWNPKCLFCTYFHENQFVYPMQEEDTSRFQFSAINFTTATVSDRLAFNSTFNWRSFYSGCSQYIKKAVDIDIHNTLSEIKQKSSVIYPGIDFDVFSRQNFIKNNRVPTICWNHRWEHDKNPESFFNALDEIDSQGIDFRLVILGQSFRHTPRIFESARQKFRSKIDHFGFAKSRKQYASLLEKCDIVVSTSIHEFFGISIIEAVRAGCLPLVPNRLSYPELYSEEFLYNDGELTTRLVELIGRVRKCRSRESAIDTDEFSWQAVKKRYAEWLFSQKRKNAISN